MSSPGFESRRQALAATMAMMANAGDDASPLIVAPVAVQPMGASRAALLTTDGLHGEFSGQTWAGYEIGDLLGSGGMGAVYRARQLSVGRLVALKILPRGVADVSRRERFAAEVRAAARVRSPHVATVYDSGEYDGQLWLAMELVEGGTLADRLRLRAGAGNPFSVDEALGLALQVARGLADAHLERLVHRDIKPANLLVGDDGVLRIADFGLVRILDERSLTVTGTVLGTPQYLSPEQGRGLTTDARGDIYSLGVVLYELLTMRLPFSGGTVDELVAQHNFTEPAFPSTLVPGLSKAVDAVCLTCLQKDPRNRYPDALVLADDLQRIMQGLAPMAAIHPGRMSTGADLAVARLAGHRRQWLVAAGMLAAVALALAGGWWWQDERKTEITVLHSRLAPVLAVGPLPVTVEADLARLAALSGDTDALVAAGRMKLTRIEQAVATLTAFARKTASDQPTLADGEAALAELIAAVGPDGHPQLGLWRQLVHEGASRRDRQDPPPAGSTPSMFRYTGEDLSLSPAKEAELRSRLVQLVDARPEQNPLGLGMAQFALMQLRQHCGNADPDVQRWEEVLGVWSWLFETPKRWHRRAMLSDSDLAMARQQLAACQARFAGTQAVHLVSSCLDALVGPPAPPWAAAHGHDGQGPWLDLAIGDVRQRLRWLIPRLSNLPRDKYVVIDESSARARLANGVWIADRECTHALWSAVMGSSSSAGSDPLLPVVEVSREDADQFCRKLGEVVPGCHARIPSEIEWELAASVGSSTGRSDGDDPWGGIGANAIRCASSGPAPAGSLPANLLGLYDMLGNVSEWCRDDYGTRRDAKGRVTVDPTDRRGVVRGGSWADPLDACRLNNRSPADPAARSPRIGFRFVVVP